MMSVAIRLARRTAKTTLEVGTCLVLAAYVSLRLGGIGWANSRY